MPTYDFKTIIPRPDCGSFKWEEMRPYQCPEDIIPFSVADMELRTMPEVTEGLKQFLDQNILGYTGPTKEYKKAVTDWMLRHHNWVADPDWIVTTPGVVQAFFTAVRTFTNPGDSVLLLTPVYYPMYFAIERNNRKIAASPLINTGGRYTIDFADFEAKAKLPETKLFLLCSPHNPTGRVWTKEELQELSRICLENNVFVCSDEIHNDLIFPGYTHTVFASLSKEAEQNCMVCTAPSKTFNLAGAQTSNIFLPNPEVRKQFTEELHRQGSSGCNILGLEACRLAYTHGDQWLAQLMTLLETNQQTIRSFFQEHYPMVTISPLEGTYLLWLDLRKLEPDAKKLAHLLREKGQLFFDDGYIFGDEGAGFERWNLACPTSYIEAALQRFDAIFKQN